MVQQTTYLVRVPSCPFAFLHWRSVIGYVSTGSFSSQGYFQMNLLPAGLYVSRLTSGLQQINLRMAVP